MLDVTELDMRRRVPKCDSTFCRVCDEFPVLRQGNARVMVTFGKWPLRDYRPCGCIDLLDFSVGYDKEVIVGPEEASVE